MYLTSGGPGNTPGYLQDCGACKIYGNYGNYNEGAVSTKA